MPTRDPEKKRAQRQAYERSHPERATRFRRLASGAASGVAPGVASGVAHGTGGVVSAEERTLVKALDLDPLRIVAGDSAGPVVHPKVRVWKPGALCFGEWTEVDATEEDE